MSAVPVFIEVLQRLHHASKLSIYCMREKKEKEKEKGNTVLPNSLTINFIIL